jgi:hypothetical protein
MKSARVFEGFTSLLAPIIIYKLLSFKNITAYILLLIIVLINLKVGGKSTIFMILLPLAACELTHIIKFRFKTIVFVFIIISLGITLSLYINYRNSDTELLLILYNRLASEGDVYDLVFGQSLIQFIEVNSLFLYLIGPFVKLFSPSSVDLNIGAQVGSLVSGESVFTGPNGHWPILLISHGLDSYALITIITFLFFLILISTKFLLIRNFLAFRNPIFFTIPVVSFTSLYPQTIYSEPSNFSLYFLHLLFVSLLLTTIYTVFRFLTRHLKEGNRNINYRITNKVELVILPEDN